MKKTKLYRLVIFLIVIMLALLVFMNKISVTKPVEPLKNTEEIEKIAAESEIDSDKADEPEWTERIAYETTADLTHDGIADLIRLIVTPDEEGISTEELLVKYMHLAIVKVYQGIDGEQFEIEPCYESQSYAVSHVGNGTVCLIGKDGMDYLMTSSAYEMQGRASYHYQVFYIEGRNIVTVDEGETSFVTSIQELGMTVEELHEKGEVLREEAIPAYKEKILPWVENSNIIVSLDIEHYDSQLFMSTEEKICPASEYFNLVWTRKTRD